MAAPGDVDPGFDPKLVGAAKRLFYGVSSITLQADGKILVAGGVADDNIARLNANGTLDTGFHPNVKLVDESVDGAQVASMALQADGKILIGGRFDNVGGVVRNNLARINANGTLDTGFDPNVFVPDYSRVSSIALQTDGKILIGGGFNTVGGVRRNNIARLNADGTLDAAFNPNADLDITSIALQAGGKILIGGSFTTVGGVARRGIARLNADGTLDTDFNPKVSGGSFGDSVSSIVLQADGKILIGGSFTAVGGVARHNFARLNAGGALDTNFNPNVSGGTDDFPIVSIALQADGKILIGGGFTAVGGVARNHIARLNANGTLDAGFNPNISGGFPGASVSIALQTDGKILIGGDFTTVGGVARYDIARLNASGTPDTGFDPKAFDIPSVFSIAVQADGNILIGGDFTTVGGVARNNIARLKADGTLETAFSPSVSAPTDEFPFVSTIVVQADKKLLIGGHFTTVGGVARNNIARLNADGTLDAGFNPNVSAPADEFPIVSTIALQPDGKILIGGDFSTVGGVARKDIARLKANGTLDTAFHPNVSGDPAYSAVYSIALQAGGKILIGGLFTTVGGVMRHNIARLDATGTLDTGFNPNVSGGPDDSPYVGVIALQADGKILIGGDFTTVGGVPRHDIARLSATGTLDNGFNPNVSGAANARSEVYSIGLQADGKILVGGSFTTVSGAARNRIARLNVTGALDTGFDPNVSGNAYYLLNVYSIVLQTDGKILIGGDFTAVGGVARNSIARLEIDAGDPSSRADLASLVLSAGTLNPSFANTTTSYAASVSGATMSITVTPTTANSHATVKVNGVSVASGTASGAIGLSVGENIINTVVTAQDGTTKKTYTLSVTRASSPPSVTTTAASGVAFNGATLNGTVNPNGLATTVHFEYGLTTAYGTSTANKSVGAGTSAVAVQAAIGNLTPNTTWHYRLVATNGNVIVKGVDRTFTTPDNAVVGTWAERTVLRTLPAAVGKKVDIGTLTFNGGTGSIEASVNATGPGWSVAKRYVIPIGYNVAIGFPPATWLKVLPTQDTGPYGVNDFDLDVNVSGATALLRLRTVGSNGNAATARISIKTTGLQTFVNSSAAAAVAVPAQTVVANAVDELNGKAGIGVAPAGSAVVDINGGDTRGLRVRPRSTPGAPTAGTWNKGTIILDSGANLFICTASGTPGAWKKVGAP